MNFYLKEVNKVHVTCTDGLTCLWGGVDSNIMIKGEYIKLYKENIFPIRVEYIITAGPHCTTHGVKFPFFIILSSARYERC